jgi:hypothetical protein
MTINLCIAIDTNLKDNTFDVYVSEGESGCQINFTDIPFSPEEHPEFNEKIGNEIYSWVCMGMEADEEDEENE